MYNSFAQYYDSLTDNVEYKKRCDYFLKIMSKFNHKPILLLDLACGTGSLSFEFAKKNIDVIAVDSSYDMLSIAQEKKFDYKEENIEMTDVLFLCQSMEKLDLFGTIDTAVCALDSLNHLKDISQLDKAFAKVSLFLEPNGLFIFDVNTIYKHKNVLSNNVFVYDVDKVYCVWQNEYSEIDNRVDIHLDFFEKENDCYYRSEEDFSEIAFSFDDIEKLLQKNGLEKVALYGDLNFESPKDDEERAIFVCRKVN